MALQAEEAINQRIIPLFFQQGNRQELALGFAHFSGAGIQMVHMEPLRAPLMPHIAFALGTYWYDAGMRYRYRRSADPDTHHYIS